MNNIESCIFIDLKNFDMVRLNVNNLKNQLPFLVYYHMIKLHQ